MRDLRFQYEDGTAALRGVNFRLDPGETVALLGANGSGKTTFVLHLNGLLAGSGSVEVCGLPVKQQNLADDPPEDRPGVSGFRKPAIHAHRARRRRLRAAQPWADSRTMPSIAPLAALERVGMSAAANKAPYHLSAGEKKRVAIAGILAMDPEILVLDEPTTFLDPPGQRALAELLAGLPQAKILVTHDIPFALAMCTRAVFFQNGVIAAEGPVEELVSRFGWDLSG